MCCSRQLLFKCSDVTVVKFSDDPGSVWSQLNFSLKRIIKQQGRHLTVIKYPHTTPSWHARAISSFFPFLSPKLNPLIYYSVGVKSWADPELYILINGKPAKDRIVWHSLVEANDIKAAVAKLRDTNWLYTDVEDT